MGKRDEVKAAITMDGKKQGVNVEPVGNWA